MRLALIGDIHHFRLNVSARKLLGKRLLGQTNLWLNRQYRFNHALLRPLFERVAQIEPDMILLTGDVTTTSLEDEFHDVVAFLKPLSDRFPLLVVPGNHDRYTFASARKKRIETVLRGIMPQSFPHFVKLNARWRLLGLDAARPQVVLSRGQLGRRQLEQARRHVQSLEADQGVVVLCHYPLGGPPNAPPETFAHSLAERRPLRAMLATCPARVLYLHGHIHRPWHWQPRQPKLSRLTSLNAGAPCMATGAFPGGQGFWELNLPDDPSAAIRLVHHVPHTPSDHNTILRAGDGAVDGNYTWRPRRIEVAAL